MTVKSKLKINSRRNLEEVVIGLDVSTTATKAIAINKIGNILAYSAAPIKLYSPRKNYYEQNPNDWWKSTQKVLRNISRQIEPSRIKALAISNQRETFAVFDKSHNLLRPAIIWLDERCKDEVIKFSEKIGKKKIHRITGKPVDFAPVAYRLAWMKKHEPSIYKKIHRIFDVQSYLVWKLTGFFKTSWASADPLGLFDLKKKIWSETILDTLKLTESQLPLIYSPGTNLGSITEKASKQTGLNIGTLIIAGGGDGQSGGLGAGVLNSKRAYLNLGTAVVMGLYGEKYLISNAFRTMGSFNDTGYYYESSLRAGTFTLNWFIKNILRKDPDKSLKVYMQLEKDAERINTGSDGLFFLPYLSGAMNPYWDTDAKGTFVGIKSSHAHAHFYKAILEGIAFEQLLVLNSIKQKLHTDVRELIAIGGGASNRLWCQILADITGKNILLQTVSESSALGAGIAASVGIGWYNEFEIAVKKMSHTKIMFRPDNKKHIVYKSLFPIYKRIYPALKTGKIF